MLEPILAALRGGNLAAAAAAARALLDAEPDHAEAHHLLSLALRQLGDLPAAEIALDRALTLAPERAPYHVSRAALARLRNDPDAARAALEAALKQDPNHLLAYLSLAELALAASDLDQAEQHLRFAERINPDHPHVEVQRAQLLLARGQGAAALRLLNQTVQRVPEDAMVLGALGLAYLNQRHFAFAEQTLRKALVAQPKARELRYALTNALLAQDRNDEAAQEAAALVEADGNDPRALTLQGQIATDRNESDLAVTALTASLRLHPAQPHALDALLRNWNARGERATAVNYVESLLVARPRLEFVWSALIQLLRGDHARVAAAAARWSEACPDSSVAGEIAAQAFEAAGDRVRAEAIAHAAVAIDPQRVGAQLVLARSELRSGAAAAAVERLRPLLAAIEQPAVRLSLTTWLARANDAAGQYEDALRGWCEAQVLSGAAADTPRAVPDAALAAAVSAATPLPGAHDAPILLWGAPGSGVERVAAVLSGVESRGVLGDRFGPAPRLDDFQEFWVERLPDTDAGAAAQAFAQRWHDGLASLGVSAAAVVDWLPDWDARWLPALQRAMPGARLIAALADPRDMLLHWIAFGSPQGGSAADPLAAAKWLAATLEHLVFTREHAASMLLIVRADDVLAAPANAASELATFLGQPMPLSTDTLQALTQAGDNAFPAGYWRHYADALREPFALLAPIAARLGYA